MPSKTKAQANLMSAIAHGWHPPQKHAPSLAVAKEFHKADKRQGVYEHATGYADGGKVGQVVSFAKSVLPQIEKEFSNTYTADTDRLRGLISKYWDVNRPPDAPVTPTAPVMQKAEGGTVNTTQKGLDLISHAADRATSFLLSDPNDPRSAYHDPHHLLGRVAAGLGSQVLGLDKSGRPQLGKTPGLVKEAESIPAGLVDIGEGATRLGAAAGDALGDHAPPGMGAIQAARTILDKLHARYGSDLAPAWSRSAEASADQTHRAVRDAMGLPAPRGAAENLAEAGGTMLGQLPIGAERATESTLAKLAKSPAEWLGPTIRPSLSNYGVGTLAGGIMGAVGDDPAPPQGLQGHAEGGKVDMLRRGLLKGMAGMTAAGVIGGEKMLKDAGHAVAAAPKMTEEHLVAPDGGPYKPKPSVSLLKNAVRAFGRDGDVDAAYEHLQHARGTHPHIDDFLDDMDDTAARGGGDLAHSIESHHANLDKALLELDPKAHADYYGGKVGQWYNSPAHEGAPLLYRTDPSDLSGESDYIGTFDGMARKRNYVIMVDEDGERHQLHINDVLPPKHEDLLQPDDGP